MSARRHSDSSIVKVIYVISNNILYYFIDKTKHFGLKSLSTTSKTCLIYFRRSIFFRCYFTSTLFFPLQIWLWNWQYNAVNKYIIPALAFSILHSERYHNIYYYMIVLQCIDYHRISIVILLLSGEAHRESCYIGSSDSVIPTSTPNITENWPQTTDKHTGIY